MADKPTGKTSPAERFGGFEKSGGPGRPQGSRNRVPINKQLKDMRHVYRTEKEGGEGEAVEGDTPGQAKFRAMCRENPKDFLAMMLKMEQEHRAILEKGKKADAAKVAGPSEGTGELLDVIDRLLDEWEDSRAEAQK